MRLIDCDALKKDWSMADHCEDCPQKVIACQYDQVFTRMDICQMLDDAPTVGEWISVEDRLPEQSGEVFVHTKNHYTACVSYSKKYNAFNWFDVLGEVRERYGGTLWDVEYWMPIPPLPEAPHDVP